MVLGGERRRGGRGGGGGAGADDGRSERSHRQPRKDPRKLKRARFRLAAMLALAAISGCGGTNRCKEGTLLVTVTFKGAAVAATTVDVEVTIDSGQPKTQPQPLAHQSGIATGSIEIFFPTKYPRGSRVQVT